MRDNMSGQRPEFVQNPVPTAVQTTIPIAEAASRLGISADAVRKRIQRGKLSGQKTDQGWTVDWLEPDIGPETVQTTSSELPALVESLQLQIDYLKDQVQAERDARAEAERRHAAEIERRDILMREALDRIPQGPLALPSDILDANERLAGTIKTPDAPVERPEAPGRADPLLMGDSTLRGAYGEPMPTQVALATGWRRWWRRIMGHEG
jgi:hypothetical protein